MNAIFLISCLIVLGTASASTRQQYNDLRLKKFQERIEIDVKPLQELIDKYVALLKTYDPLNIAEYVFDHQGYKFSFTNIHADSFSNVISQVSADIGFLSADVIVKLKVPKVFVSVKLWESNFPVAFGSGSAELEINNLELLATVNYSYFNGIQPSDVTTSVKSINARITGIQNNESLSAEISNKIETYVAGAINNSEFHKLLEKILDEVIAKYL
ncbi:hypothetical protein RN001_007079 [Aquatica leii]|uniref:Uncharacterized protein n=1 Tax=Aquatica leii TaxID=1421715 RepID=A0AAN7P949_9COLE|nr:hypothetical protein RN001_007079 [Aquatica leii]